MQLTGRPAYEARLAGSRMSRKPAQGGTATLALRASPPPVTGNRQLTESGRVEAFSDAFFAITITLLVLEIRPPADYGNLLHDLLALWPSYLAYAVTFLFIGQVWANHHVMFDHIRAADRVVLLLNTLLLMVVAFLPFATSVLAGAFREPRHASRSRAACSASSRCFRGPHRLAQDGRGCGLSPRIGSQ